MTAGAPYQVMPPLSVEGREAPKADIARRFKTEVDGMGAAARERRKRGDGMGPSLDRILNAAEEFVALAVRDGVYRRGTPAFDFGDDQTVWIDEFPCGEWVSRSELLRDEVGDDFVALRVFDPNLRESIHWFLRTEDRRRWEKQLANRRHSRSPERDRVENPVAEHLRSKGRKVRQQVSCAGGRIDIYDITAKLVIECKASGSAEDIAAAVTQLRRYAGSYPDCSLVVAVPFIDPDALWLATAIRVIGIHLIEIEKGIDL
ncbi:MAG: hypothetical protein A3E78_07440 [Alphaproteobacteria bacterium RIFCSPHIGHO2_12_FULL_63_12]|nr:MAG: hypothetical protein A3E78_07440 [Alphaproteobacteria bacterium RIFCSPHIGHO2_12_FULL_63_12]